MEVVKAILVGSSIGLILALLYIGGWYRGAAYVTEQHKAMIEELSEWCERLLAQLEKEETEDDQTETR